MKNIKETLDQFANGDEDQTEEAMELFKKAYQKMKETTFSDSHENIVENVTQKLSKKIN